MRLSPADSIAGALYQKLQTQSSAPEEGRNYRPKQVELIEVINEAASSVLYTTSCKHSLVLLRKGEIIARNTLS
jgi:hypothetical protein